MAEMCYLESHLAHEDGREDIVGDGEEDSLLVKEEEVIGQNQFSHPLSWPKGGAGGRFYQAALVDLGPLQGHGDAVGEDEGQNHIVKELVGDDGLAQLSEPSRRSRVWFSR